LLIVEEDTLIPMVSPIKIIALLIAVPLLVCSKGTLQVGRPKVFVSIIPQAYFVEEIGGGHIEVEVLVPPGHNHETFEPTPRQLVALSQAKVYFTIGMPFEAALIKKLGANMPSLQIISTYKGIQLREMTEHHSHGDNESQVEAYRDPHIWLDPQLVKIQSENIFKALVALDAEHKKDYEKNLQFFAAELDSLNSKIKRILMSVQGASFLVFHPAYGYFAARYDLKQIAIEQEGKEPTAHSLAEIIELSKQLGIRAIFVDAQAGNPSIQKIAEAINAEVVVLDPLAKDYMNNMIKTAELVRQWSTKPL